MARNVFVVEFGVKYLVDSQASLVRLCKDGVEFGRRDTVDSLRVLGHAGALLREAFHPDNPCLWEGARPLGDKDMMLKIGGNNVRDGGRAENFANGGSESYGREDGIGVVLEADWQALSYRKGGNEGERERDRAYRVSLDRQL